MNNTIEIIRGIPTFIVNREYVKRGILTPEHIYTINKTYTTTYKLSKKQRVIGVVIDKEFTICYYIKLKNGETAFGYFVSDDAQGNYSFQRVNEFNKFAYDPYKALYPLGKEICIKENEIQDAVYQWKDLFYEEFS